MWYRVEHSDNQSAYIEAENQLMAHRLYEYLCGEYMYDGNIEAWKKGEVLDFESRVDSNSPPYRAARFEGDHLFVIERGGNGLYQHGVPLDHNF